MAGTVSGFAPMFNRASSRVFFQAGVDFLGALPLVGFFDPLDFASKADDLTMKRYREAEVTHTISRSLNTQHHQK
jgi:hypothetical protein